MPDLKWRMPDERLRQSWHAQGFWTDDTFVDFVPRELPAHHRSKFRLRSSTRPFEGTIGDVAAQADRLAGFLVARGIGPGDVVAIQLPNWTETVATIWGLLSLGVILVPIVHIYGHKELGHILKQSEARVLVTTHAFGRQNFSDNLQQLRKGLPDLELVIMVENKGDAPELDAEIVSWKAVMDANRAMPRIADVDPDSPVVFGYTSGTTAAPKGVIHTHRTLLAEMRQYASFVAGDTSPPTHFDRTSCLSSAPISHITGFMRAIDPLFAGGGLDILDQWIPATVLAAMREEKVGVSGGPTFFLSSLIEDPTFEPATHVPLMARMSLGGSPIPPEIARRAAALGISITRAYGSTEHPSTTATLHRDPEDKRLYTDGRALPGVELRIVDALGNDLPRGEPGEILSRGPDLFVGYVDSELTDTVLDADGWYATGDIGILDREGFLTISDRKKDIIIRGGENISAAEVEGALQTIPSVAEVAVVAAPDIRYGERGCAYVRLSPQTQAFDIETMRAHLNKAGLARQKWPEDLRFVEDFPRTPSGKIQKHVLRSQLKSDS